MSQVLSWYFSQDCPLVDVLVSTLIVLAALSPAWCPSLYPDFSASPTLCMKY